MSLLFLNGLMPERHAALIRRLGREHTLTGTRLGTFHGDPDLRIIDFPSDLPLSDAELAAQMQDRIREQTLELAASLARDLCAVPGGPVAGWQLSATEIETSLRPRVARQLVQLKRFRTFAEHHRIGLVLSGADYSGPAHPIARLARQMGLPTLDVEHGFFFNGITPEYSRTRGKLPPLFASEYVNVDNAMEQELLGREADLFPHPDTHFIGLGTPVTTVANTAIDRETARKALNLAPGLTTIAIMGSWHEARSVQKLVTAQLDTIAAYEELFRALQTSELAARVQLVLKLHPADAHPDVLAPVSAGLTALADSCGLPAPLIKTDMLPEVLAASDVVLSLGYSSVLYDAFVLGKPSVVLFPRFLVYSDKPAWGTESTLPQRHGVSTATASASEAWQLVAAALTPDGQRQFARHHADFTRKYGLQPRSVAEKCESVATWINGVVTG